MPLRWSAVVRVVAAAVADNSLSVARAVGRPQQQYAHLLAVGGSVEGGALIGAALGEALGSAHPACASVDLLRFTPPSGSRACVARRAERERAV